MITTIVIVVINFIFGEAIYIIWMNKRGSGGTSSYLIAEIANQTKSENFEHLIIVNDGKVYEKDIDLCDKLVQKYDIQFSYASVYIIGDDRNESVGCPFCRGYPGSTIKKCNNGTEKKLASMSLEDKKELKNINNINSWNSFKDKYENLFNAIRAECLGKEKNEDLKKKLDSVKSKMSDYGAEKEDFEIKFKKLYDMADGKIRDVKSAESITAG